MDELLREMYSYVIDRFAAALKQAVEDNPCHHVTISMGVAYVEFLQSIRTILISYLTVNIWAYK